jgi:hypothetical protein
MMRSLNALLVVVVTVAVAPAYAQRAVDPVRVASAEVTDGTEVPHHRDSGVNRDNKNALRYLCLLCGEAPPLSPPAPLPARQAQPCTTITQANADASAGTVNINHDGSAIPGTPAMHGAKDSIVPAATSRRAVAALQAVGAPHIYLEFPDKDHEFWIRRGAAQMEKVFLFFSLVSKRTTVR